MSFANILLLLTAALLLPHVCHAAATERVVGVSVVYGNDAKTGGMVQLGEAPATYAPAGSTAVGSTRSISSAAAAGGGIPGGGLFAGFDVDARTRDEWRQLTRICPNRSYSSCRGVDRCGVLNLTLEAADTQLPQPQLLLLPGSGQVWGTES